MICKEGIVSLKSFVFSSIFLLIITITSIVSHLAYHIVNDHWLLLALINVISSQIVVYFNYKDNHMYQVSDLVF